MLEEHPQHHQPGDFGDADNFLGVFFQAFSEQWGFKNQEIFSTLNDAERETDQAKRVELYKRAQQILIERGPVIVPFFETAAAGVSGAVEGVELAPDWSRTSFMSAYRTR